MGFLDFLSPVIDWLGEAGGNSDAWNLLDQGSQGLNPADAFANYGSEWSGDYGFGQGADITSGAFGMAPPTESYADNWATFNSPYTSGSAGGGSVIPEGIDWSKWAGPAIGAGSTLLGSGLQGLTAGKTNKANREAYAQEEAAKQAAYQQYLDNLNPPESVRDSRQAQLQAEVEAKAPEMTRRTRDVLAEHGVRGRGKASSVAQTQSKLDQARNQAYWQTHGNFATPGAPRQTTNVPATPDLGVSDFLGKNLADLGSAWFAYSYAPEYLRRKY